MFYFLFEYLENQFQLTGASLFQYISFRSSLAFIFSLFFSITFGKKIINFLNKKQIGESIRDLGLIGQKEKNGTPTMGGLIIIFSTIIPVLLFSNFTNVYILLLLFTTIWLGIIGFLDDYIKVFKKNKKGLKGRFKIIGQISLGLIVGLTLFFHPQVTLKNQNNIDSNDIVQVVENSEYKSTKTTVPFLKNNEFDYSFFSSLTNNESKTISVIIFVFFVILIITSVSNAANLTDGIDGLAAGSSVIITLTLGVFAWVSGNIIFSEYLNIMYIPRVGEVVIFISSFIGGLIGFLWYNTYPAQVFMGDTGSLTIGGVIAVIAIIVRKELLLPLICGVFLIETLSVIIQVTFFKYTKSKKGVGQRIFLMSPIHHHFQKTGLHESKIVVRFWIIGILLAILSLITLKIR
ncbi:MAG: phospho-N-acetylmuramoyl-pentapeptide-transferase [Flavobacteriaceae bacterium]|jgi:phospho-N-acetylmuramoyl-pentapeptide-transferase|nr:phospho-N-acetylmuramoyl-pentapeptide-transferase [Flavobacteriaceae bacterium]MBT4297443.1 phospho-N-acetylmuramoyl-pentapeptide-transferase [Flavobacteriaceae bacterium]MBT4960122.1 phospho-N-acetylmuramoyl-pentapeptide-transferase [Flavobacteriaceae bacterium]MBT5232353.1 phospho-N-acetylmuramoyl-pentapeptide-transferase [Flavobacteriaceae bacterium]MBT5493245.1 phospho-N-acetylmuramoyl-pentapeptide-transferase [Flavobacteriaceae bacterium]|tara:strand:- start:9285 stop:10499 length:1215 start_codon:yes stop_codon:yes gene_type:complete